MADRGKPTALAKTILRLIDRDAKATALDAAALAEEVLVLHPEADARFIKHIVMEVFINRERIKRSGKE